MGEGLDRAVLALEILWERSEPKPGCCQLLETQRKRGLGGRLRGLAWGELLMPIASLVANILGSLRV